MRKPSEKSRLIITHRAQGAKDVKTGRRLLVGNTCPVGQFTMLREASDHDGMSEAAATTRRRSGRAFHKMRLQAQGRAHNGKKFKESCETVVVNAHGGLLLLKHEIDNGEMLILTNPETLEDQECRVVYQGEPCEKGQRIGVEFLTPAPRFWGLEFGEIAATDQTTPDVQ